MRQHNMNLYGFTIEGQYMAQEGYALRAFNKNRGDAVNQKQILAQAIERLSEINGRLSATRKQIEKVAPDSFPKMDAMCVAEFDLNEYINSGGVLCAIEVDRLTAKSESLAMEPSGLTVELGLLESDYINEFMERAHALRDIKVMELAVVS